LVGGIISISAVILLSFLSQDMVEEGGFIQRMLVPVPTDSIEVLEDSDTLDPERGGPPSFIGPFYRNPITQF